MEKREIFENLSPLDHRYYSANKELFTELGKYLSEKASVKYLVRVETALLKGHLRNLGNRYPDSLTADIASLTDRVSPEEVYQEEEVTKHNIRALVNVLKKKAPEEIRRYIHLGATSVDILDTAFSMRIRDAVRNVLLPLCMELEDLLIDLTLQEAETVQVGRTHGQFAIPVTFGFTSAEYVARLGKSIEEIFRRVSDLRGKISGAVGAYNAMSLIQDNPEAFEQEVLSDLGLKPSEYSNQLAEPEYLLRLLLELNTCFGIFANLADDLRNLQRSEIAEVQELFSQTQVGSSTMPQKRNPWNSEHVKSLWKAYAPRVITFYMDQISEHQRDLTNSASSRFVTEYLAGFTGAAARLKKILSTLKVNRDRMKQNLEKAGDVLLSESAYILLSLEGEPEGHEIIRKITLACEQNKTSLIDEIRKRPDIYAKISGQLQKRQLDPEQFFGNPENYTGRAGAKAVSIANRYRKKIDQLKEET
ncbi:MAG: lyase family protein [Spirochaetia bacterium]